MSFLVTDFGVSALVSRQQVTASSLRACPVHRPRATRLHAIAYSEGSSRLSPNSSDERDERTAGRGAGRGGRGGRGSGASGGRRGRGGRRPSPGDDPAAEPRGRILNPPVDPPRMKVNRASRRAAERELVAAEAARSPPASGDAPRTAPPHVELQNRGGSEAPRARKALGSGSKQGRGQGRGRGRGATANAPRQTPASQPKPSQVGQTCAQTYMCSCLYSIDW